jgi:hypothetical protein
MMLSWKTECDRIISGYNIYVADTPLAAGQTPDFGLTAPYNETVFPGDTDPTDGLEKFDLTGLNNGRPYFVSVRVVYPDGTVSDPTNEIRAFCGPRGEFLLAVRFGAKNDGFSFSSRIAVRADDGANDLCFYSRDGADYLVSPSHIDAFLNRTTLNVLSSRGNVAEAGREVSTLSIRPSSEKVAVAAGDWIWAMTNQGQALLQVLGFEDAGATRQVRLYYAYVPSMDSGAFR